MVKVQQVIICDKGTRGDGKSLPVRSVTEVFDFDGNLIAESDPHTYSIEHIRNFALMYLPKGQSVEEIEQQVRDYFINKTVTK